MVSGLPTLCFRFPNAKLPVPGEHHSSFLIAVWAKLPKWPSSPTNLLALIALIALKLGLTGWPLVKGELVRAEAARQFLEDFDPQVARIEAAERKKLCPLTPGRPMMMKSHSTQSLSALATTAMPRGRVERCGSHAALNRAGDIRRGVGRWRRLIGIGAATAEATATARFGLAHGQHGECHHHAGKQAGKTEAPRGKYWHGPQTGKTSPQHR